VHKKVSWRKIVTYGKDSPVNKEIEGCQQEPGEPSGPSEGLAVRTIYDSISHRDIVIRNRLFGLEIIEMK